MDGTALRLTDAMGRTLALDQFEVTGLLELLDAHPAVMGALAAGTVPSTLAHEAGLALASCDVRLLSWEGGRRIVTGSNLGTDPVVAWCARLAEQVGSEDLAGEARSVLLAQARGLVTEDAAVRARVRAWAAYLLTAVGDLEVDVRSFPAR